MHNIRLIEPILILVLLKPMSDIRTVYIDSKFLGHFLTDFIMLHFERKIDLTVNEYEHFVNVGIELIDALSLFKALIRNQLTHIIQVFPKDVFLMKKLNVFDILQNRRNMVRLPVFGFFRQYVDQFVQRWVGVKLSQFGFELLGHR